MGQKYQAADAKLTFRCASNLRTSKLCIITTYERYIPYTKKSV